MRPRGRDPSEPWYTDPAWHRIDLAASSAWMAPHGAGLSELAPDARVQELRRALEMSYQDRQLTCADCGATFTDSAEDQAFRAERGYTNEPRRCPTCREARRSDRGGGGGGGGGGWGASSGYGGGGGGGRRGAGGHAGGRQMFDVVCASCGKETQVPFQPRGDRPVYCSDCFQKQGGGSRGGYGGGGGRDGGGYGGGGYGGGRGGRSGGGGGGRGGRY